MKTSIKQFDNYSLASVQVPSSKIAKAIITVDLHTTNSTPKQTGLLMLADSLLSGAGKFSRDEFLNEINKLGASVDINVGGGQITFSLRATEETFPKLLKLFSTMVLNPTFSAKELKRIKSTTKNELHQAKEDSKSAALSNLKNLFYTNKDRHYSYEIDDIIKAVDSIGAGDLKQLHKLLLGRPWFSSVAGSKSTVETFGKTLESINKNFVCQPETPTVQTRSYKPCIELEHIPSRQNIDFSIGLPVPLTARDHDYVPLSFGIAVLAKWGGFAGRLMSTVREKEGLTYGIYGQIEGIHPHEPGYFRIMTFFSPDKSEQALTSTFREIKNIYTKGITEAEFTKFKTIQKTQQTLLRDSLSRLLGDIHAYHCQGFTVEEISAHKNRINEISRKEVNAAIKKYLHPSNMPVSGAGPVKAVKKQLEGWYKSMS